MNKHNIEIVKMNVCTAFGDMSIPSTMGIDILRIALDNSAELPDEPTGRMREDFIKMSSGMTEMFLNGDDNLTIEEINEGYAQVIVECQSFIDNGPTPEQQQLLDMMKAITGEDGGSSNDSSNSTLH